MGRTQPPTAALRAVGVSATDASGERPHASQAERKGKRMQVGVRSFWNGSQAVLFFVFLS